MKVTSGFCNSAEKYIAARNALVAKYTLEALDQDKRRQVDAHIIDLLILSGINTSRAEKYKSQLRETQYYGMAAKAMSFLGIRPALSGILFQDQWEHFPNPLVALSGAHIEIQLASNEILKKQRVLIVIRDENRQRFRWEIVIPESRRLRDVN